MAKIITTDEYSRLIDIKDEMKRLAREAMAIVRNTSEEGRARGYWYGHIISNLDSDHSFMGHQTTLSDTAEALIAEAMHEDSEEEMEGAE